MGLLKNLIGIRYGRLIVVSRSSRTDCRQNSYWICKCDCGKTKEICGCNLRSGKTNSCGCYSISRLKNSRIDLSGKTFNLLKVVSYSHQKGKLHYWSCVCDCGKEKIIEGSSLRSGNTRSCGCIIRDNLVGKRFGRWVVLEMFVINSRTKPKCQCDCGVIKNVFSGSLKSGSSISCGCYKTEFGKSKIGPKSPTWNSNLSDEQRTSNYYGRGRRFDEWAASVKKTYDYTCQKCLKKGGNLKSHHILPWSLYPKQRYRIKNGICLCNDCHIEYHKNFKLKQCCRSTMNDFLK